jgi:hypothetical protein
MSLVEELRAIEFAAFGANVLTARMLEGIAKQAVNCGRAGDRSWLLNQLKGQKKSIDSSIQGAVSASDPLVLREIQVTPGRKAEVAVKFDVKPDWRNESGKKAFFQIESAGLVWDVSVPEKALIKAFEIMDGSGSWVGVVRGGIGSRTDRGFILDAASVQVFEKIKKSTD